MKNKLKKFKWKDLEYRNQKIMKLIPEDVKTILDIGSKGDIFKRRYQTTTLDIIEEADIKQDLNKIQKLNLKDNSFDIVVMNQILEHLPYVEEIIKEAKRVSKKYIFVGLPNELTYGFRIRFLIGNPAWKGYQPYFHKHFFTIEEIEKFMINFFGGYKKKEYLFACSGAKIFPRYIKDFCANNFPSLCAKEVYYLIDLDKKNKNEKI